MEQIINLKNARDKLSKKIAETKEFLETADEEILNLAKEDSRTC